MSRPVEWLGGAESELQAAFAKFEDQREGAGTGFFLMVEAYLGRISHFPEVAPIYLQRICRQVMKQSVYGIFTSWNLHVSSSLLCWTYGRTCDKFAVG